MALIPQDKLNVLIPASDVKSTADTACAVLEEQSVAFMINSAANTGAHQCLYNHPISESLISKLKKNGYTVAAVKDVAVYGSQYWIGGF